MSWEAEAARAAFVQQRTRQKESAWLVAALTRAKKLPDFGRFVEEQKSKAAPKKQTWQEMKAALKAITGHA